MNAKLQETHALNVRLAIIAREKREAARRAKRQRAKEKARRKRAARHPLQDLWDRNGAAIYDANQAFKTKYGKNMSAKVRRKAIKDATRNGVFNAGAYAGNLVKAVTPPPPPNPYAAAADRIRAGANEIDDEKKIGYQDAPLPKKPSYVVPDMSWKRDDMRAADAATAHQNTTGPKVMAIPVPGDPPPVSEKCWWPWFCRTWDEITGKNKKQSTQTVTPTSAVDAIYTQAYETVAAGLTQTARPTATPTFTPTATPTITTSPTLTPTATPAYTPVPGGTGKYSNYWYGKEFYDILNPLSSRNLISDRSTQWWDNYQGEPFGEKTFLAITYNYEMSSLGSDPIAKELVTEAFSRRYWQSQFDYGPDNGKYFYVGGRDMARLRALNGAPGVNEGDYNMSSAMIEADRILNTDEWQNGVSWDKPYDWGNPFSEQNPETTKRIKHFLPEFWKALQNRNMGPADDQILYISNEGDFFVVTQGQTIELCKNESCVNPFPDQPVP